MRPYNGVPGFAGLPYAPHQPPVVSNSQPFYANHAGPDPDYGRSASVGADAALVDSPLVNVAYAAVGLGVGAAVAYFLVRKI